MFMLYLNLLSMFVEPLIRDLDSGGTRHWSSFSGKGGDSESKIVFDDSLPVLSFSVLILS